MSYEIMEYARLTLTQKSQAVDLFMEGFGHMMTFSKDEMCGNGIRCVGKYVYDHGLTDKTDITVETLAGIKQLKLYVEDGKVLGLLGIATHEIRPIDFRLDTCVRLFGRMKGAIISKQMNAIFQKPVVSFQDELYIDVLVTGSEARRKGVASALLNDVFKQKKYSVCYLHVFLQNHLIFLLFLDLCLLQSTMVLST